MRAVLALALAVLLGVCACAPSSGSGQHTLTVFAAASLAESFGALERRFENDHPGVDVRLNLAGSSSLAHQITEGAPADVFASADERTMQQVVETGNVEGSPATFATNRLTIAVQPGNPRGIRSFADLAGKDLTVVVCAPQVPCGAATQRVERTTGVTLRPASEEQDVKSVLTKVEVGEADAGLVYVSDVASSGTVDQVPFPQADSAVNTYPIAVLVDAAEPDLARQFRDLVLSAAGQSELKRAGFGAH